MSDSTLHPAHPGAHPDIELLADHAEGLLTPEASTELNAHLVSCPECQETVHALTELTALLGEEPAPGTMPEDIAARIDAALADEREQAPNDTDARSGGTRPVRRPAGERPSGDRPGDGRPASFGTRHRTRVRRVLTTLAIFVAAGGIGIAVSRGGDIDSASSTSASAGGSAAVAPATSPKAFTPPSYDFTQSNLAAEVQRLAADSSRHAAGQNSNGQNSTGQNSTGQSSTGQSSTGQSSSGATISPAPSPSDSGGPGRMSPNTGSEASPSPAGGEAAASANADAVPPPCVLAAVPRLDAPAVQGLGHYLGVQVFALLYPDANDPEHRWDVYLVQDSCAAPLVLLHQSVPRA